jgi:2-C-methyl-D-erythritol 4-phosphate cytidylyltransferase
MPKFAVILPAAGRSSRFGGKEKKPFVNLDGRAVWLRTAELFVTRPDVCQTIVVISPEDNDLFERRYRPNLAFMNIKVVHGGAERFESIANALKLLSADAELVAIHDAVRPCLTADLIDAVFAAAARSGSAMLALPVADTIKRADPQKMVKETVPRENLWLAQTPQVFRRDWILEAYQRRSEFRGKITDDAQLIEAAGHAVQLVNGSPLNIKITSRTDLTLAEAILKVRPDPKPNRPIHPFADEEMWK